MGDKEEVRVILIEELKELLKEDARFVDLEGKLLKNRIVELALKLDENLIRLLLKNERIKQHFFKDIDGVLIFDKEKFMKFIDNKEFLPNSYTAFKNKIGLANEEGKYLAKSKEVVLVWPYKDCVLEGGQESPDEKRKEIFHNVILAPDEIDRLLEPKVFTEFKRIDKDGEHPLEGFRRNPEVNRKRGLPEDTITDNLIVKGNNLLVLHSLLKEFRGKIKMIYIDPPYNTGKEADEFKYNDSFTHSTWLTFMKNRLEVARDLLKDDGAIFISIDDNEQAYLKVLCDEIFGRGNFIASMPWKGRGGRQDSLFVANIHEYILFYAKNSNKFVAGEMEKTNEKFPYFDAEKRLYYKRQLARKWGSHSKREDRPNLYYPIKAPDGSDVFPKLPDGSDGCWRWSKEKMEKEIKAGNIEFVKKDDEWIVYQKIYKIEGEARTKKFTTWLDGVGTTADGTKELEALFERKVFSYPKPTSLIKRLIQIANVKNGDIVLDFFAGSGTTAHAVLELNEEDEEGRQFILCEQLAYVDTVTTLRVKKVMEQIGGGDFVYMELLKLDEAFVEKIRDAKTTDELLSIWEDMKHNGFLSYRVDPRLFDENIEEFRALSLDEQRKLLLEMLEYNDLYVNYSEIEDGIYNVSEEDKKLNKLFYEYQK